MRYFAENISGQSPKTEVPLVKKGVDDVIQIMFKDGQIVHESNQELGINVCLVKGGLQFCVKGEPYLVQEGNILGLQPSYMPKSDDAVLLTLVKAKGIEAVHAKEKCGLL